MEPQEPNMEPEQKPPEEPEQPEKQRAQYGSVKNLSEAERREYNRAAKARSREKARLEKERNEIPAADDYIVPEKWDRELSSYSKQTLEQVRKEIGPVTKQDEYILTGITEISLGLERGFVQRVQYPAGILVGMWFPDALASEAIFHVSANPALLNSPTFEQLYHKMLVQVSRWANKAHPDLVEKEFIASVEAELR